jgi:L-lactate permease
MLAYVYKLTEKEELSLFRWTPKLLATGIVYLIPFVTTSLFSIELPSVVAGILGMIVYSFFIIPKQIRPNFGLWVRFLQPYLLFLVMLIATRFFLNDVQFEFFDGAKKVSLYQPGLVFLLSIVIITFLSKNKNATVLLAAKNTVLKLQKTAVTIILLVLFAQLIQAPMSRGLALVLSSEFNNIATPFLGSIGSFTLGSATMSNLIFSGALNSEGISQTMLLLALLHSGSCVGNIISLQNIFMVNSVLPETIENQRVFSINMRWFLVYMGVLIMVSLVVF